MSKIESANYVTPPLGNVTGMRCMANVVVSTAGISQGLSGLFGVGLAEGEYVSIQADGAKVYYRFVANTHATIDAFETGAGNGVAFPLPDGVTHNVIPVAGRVTSTGIATHMDFNVLQAKVASGGVQTCHVRLYRNIAPGRDAGSLKGF
jgi:hypothetical protein